MVQKIFSQELRFKDENGCEYYNWKTMMLWEIGEIITGKTPSTKDLNLWDGDIQFVTPTDIHENKYQYFTERTIKNNEKLEILPHKSIMFTCIASIGKMSLSLKSSVTNWNPTSAKIRSTEKIPTSKFICLKPTNKRAYNQMQCIVIQ